MNKKQYRLEKFDIGNKIPIKVENLASGGKSFKFFIDRNESKIENGVAYYQKQPEHKNVLVSKPILLDLIHIGISTFIADRGVKRQISRERYNTRELKVTIPVIKKERWIENKKILERVIGFLSYDKIVYEFKEFNNFESSFKDQRFSLDSDCVSLVSGGLDSFGGSQYLIQNERNPTFVSIEQGNMETMLDNVYSLMSPKYKNNKFTFRLLLNKKTINGFNDEESTQFSRSFMYLAFATAVAKELNINEIYVPETGIVATQIGLKDSRFVTRTVNPKFLKLYSELINNLFPKWEVKVKNPFKYKTKKEIINNYLTEKEETVFNTISCSNKRHAVGESHNCGICIQCLIRSISLKASSLNYNGENEIYDLINKVDLSNPKDLRDKEKEIAIGSISKKKFRDGVSLLLDIIRLARDFQYLSKKELMVKYPELEDRELFNMYKRFSKEVLEVINTSKIKSNRNLLRKSQEKVVR